MSSLLKAQQDSTRWFNDSLKAALQEVPLEYWRLKGRAGHRIAYAQDSLSDFQAFNLAEALKQNTELFVRSYGSNGIATLSVRGTSSNHNKVYWNGLDISPPNLALMDLSLLQSNPWESLEIDFGAGSMALGSGSIGAALNLHTDWQAPAKNKLALRAATGSFGRQQYQAWGQYGRGKIRAQTSFSFQAQENDYPYRVPGEDSRRQVLQNADFQQIHLQQSLNYRLKPRAILNSNIWYSRSKRSLPRILLSDADLFDRMSDDNLFWNNDYQQSLAEDRYLLKAQLGLVASSNRFQLAQSSTVDVNNFQSYQGQLRIKTGARHQLEGEIAWQGRYDVVQSEGYAGEEDRWLNALYGHLVLDWGAYGRSSLQLRSEIYDHQIAPLTGSLSWSLDHFKLKPHLSLSRNYRLPSLNDWYWMGSGNPDLKPEESYQINAGFNYELKSGPWQSAWEVHTYYMWVENWIQWQPQDNIWQPLNLKEVQNLGLDFIWRLSLNRGSWRYQADVKYQLLQNRVWNKDHRRMAEPRHLAYNPSQSLNFKPQLIYKKWRLAYQLNFTDRYFLDEANRYYLPGYVLQDLQITYGKKLKNHYLGLSFSLHNLADIDYQTIAWRPEAGINFRLGIEWRLWEKDS